MKNRNFRISTLIFTLFVGNAAFSQAPTEQNSPAELIKTEIVDGHEVMIFNTIEEKEAWIKSNPDAYAAKVVEAQQVSVTYIGTLLQVKSEVKSLVQKVESTSSSATTPANN